MNLDICTPLDLPLHWRFLMINDSIRLKEIYEIKDEAFKEVEKYSGKSRLIERIRIAENNSKELIGNQNNKTAG